MDLQGDLLTDAEGNETPPMCGNPQSREGAHAETQVAPRTLQGMGQDACCMALRIQSQAMKGEILPKEVVIKKLYYCDKHIDI